MNLDRRIQLFVALAGLFVTSLVVGDIIGVKLFEVHLGPVVAVMSMGMLPFPVTFLLTDILNEFYGKKAARFVTWVGFFMAIFTFAIVSVSVEIPWAPMTEAKDYIGTVAPSFNNVFGGSQRILMASMVAYLVGQFSDIAVFNLLKRVTNNRMLWLRATGSTVVSQLIDTVVVQFVAWTGVLPREVIFRIIFTSYAVKLLIAIGLTPLVYLGHTLVERKLGISPVVLGADGEPVNLTPASPEPPPAAMA
ncbi:MULTISPECIES: queuosine precursor transporter [Corallococcus]|uniref:queuosine precursor transporter n=1 Tax=Corallococcus TaxID=83461 RepID=UPI0011810272|nr:MULTISPECIES: queuosine precursor transporter [Corallococcus]NBD10044.1 queuosine precursor transporter [Corallococcus silvisoli]TSC28467.1 queuosine precursor transporter [Corallococcus sp. Z5C101001]